jgi:isovaleryl-CoA dehydrogenase
MPPSNMHRLRVAFSRRLSSSADNGGLLLTPEQTALVDSVDKFCRVQIDGRAIDAANEFPGRRVWREMGALGLHGITAPTEYGGLGLGYFEHCLIMETLSRHSASLALSYGAHSNLCINQISRHCSPQQKARFLPRLISGDWIGALAMSEAGAGSDVLSMRLRAVPDGPEGYRLTGHKMWITNGPDADVLFLYAKTDDHAQAEADSGHHSRGKRAISAFILETSTLVFKHSTLM